MKKYLEAAKIVAVQGIHGEVRCQCFCDSAEVLDEFETLYMGREKTAVGVLHTFPRKNTVVIKLSGIDTVEQAQTLIGKMLYIDREDTDLPEDVYFVQDIIGLTVKNAESGEVYGKISEVYQNGAADVYEIKTEDGRQLLFPCIDEVVKKIDVDNGEMLIIPLEGLFDNEN